MKISSKPDQEFHTITKLNAAYRQLESAITLYFRESDPIAVHTLACASHQIIHDINKHRGNTDLLYEKFKLRGFTKKDINRHYNFFKHADNDPDPNGEIEFKPKFTEIFILFAIKGLSELGVPYSQKMTAFMLYFQICNPRMSKLNELIGDSIPVEVINSVRWVPRCEFLDIFLRSWRQ